MHHVASLVRIHLLYANDFYSKQRHGRFYPDTTEVCGEVSCIEKQA